MKISFLYPVRAIRGSVSKGSGVYFRTMRDGSIVVCRRPVRKCMVSERQHVQQDRFRQASEFAVRIMRDPLLRQFFQSEFARDSEGCHTMRGYLFRRFYKR
ncbi:MAG: hypothetical protein IJ650_04175 [Paludibacteraceae bacterium]|nr:hypothetical protein [Paludibacteraceae bacterium]